MAIGFSFTGLVKYVTDIVKGLVSFDRVPLAPKESNAMLVHNEIQASLGEQEFRVIGGVSSDWYKENIEFGHARGKSTNSHGFIVKQNGTVVMKADSGGIFEGTSTRVYSPNNKPSPATLNAADRVHSHNELIGNNYVLGGTQNPTYFGSGKMKYQMLNVDGWGWSDTLWISSYSGGDVPVSNQIVMDKSGNGNIGFRQQRFDSTVWGEVHYFYTSAKSSGWINMADISGNFVAYDGVREHAYRVDNGTMFFKLIGMMKATAVNTVIARVPDWKGGDQLLPSIGFGDRGGYYEGKNVRIDSSGYIRIATKRAGQFSVFTGIPSIKM